MAKLNRCLHCGSDADFFVEDSGAVYAKCQNKNCNIRTPSFSASIDHSAKSKVASVWNKAQGGDEWPPWVQPEATTYYLYGARVSHGGEHWVSNLDVNVWEPGVAGWVKQ